MRSLAVAFLFVSFGDVSALAQDPAMQASQQASQAAMQASQQANQAAMQANQQAMQDAQQAANAGMQGGASCLASKPAFSVKPGVYGGPQTVFITTKARGAAIYYTTDGWTPTDQSARYNGPVTVDVTTTLRAVAFEPGCWRSQVAEAVYTLPAKDVALPVAVGADGVLRAGTELRLKFVAPVNSATAKVGDVLPLESVSEVRVGGQVFAPGTLKGNAVVTAVHRPGVFGQPGELTFAVQSLAVDGVAVRLEGVRTAEGADKISKVRKVIFIPGANMSALAIHGDNAEIAPGAVVTGRVRTDTVLPANVAQGSGQ